MTVRSYNRLSIAVFGLLVFAARPAVADGWTQLKGVGFYQARFDVLRSRAYFEPTGNRISVPLVGSYRFSLYGEYGVTNRLTIVGYLPLERLTVNRQVGSVTGSEIAAGDAENGVADGVLGLRFGLLSRGRTVVSVAASVGIPLGNDSQPSGLYTGDGEVNVHVGLELGHGFGHAAYLTASAGWNNRSRGFSDEFVYRAEIGSTLMGPLSGALRLSGYEPFKNGDAFIGGRGLRGNDQRATRIGAELRYAVDEAVGVTLGADFATRVQNGLGGTTINTGVFVRM